MEATLDAFGSASIYVNSVLDICVSQKYSADKFFFFFCKKFATFLINSLLLASFLEDYKNPKYVVVSPLFFPKFPLFMEFMNKLTPVHEYTYPSGFKTGTI